MQKCKSITAFKVILACVLVIALATQASALVTQRVTLILEDPMGDRISDDGDEVSADVGDPIDRDIFASIPDVPVDPQYQNYFFESRGSVGRFGQLGVQANWGAGIGRMVNQVIIESDEFVNLTGVEQHAVANFIIDGGFVNFFAGEESTMELQINLEAAIFQGSNFVRREDWQGGFEMEMPLGGGSPTFRAFGEDLGAVFNGMSTVDIPFSFKTFDIGTIPANGRIELEYFLHIEAETMGFTEVVNWQFSDPLTIDAIDMIANGGGRQTPTFSVVFSPGNGGGGGGNGAVPEPITATLGLMGLGALGLATRRRAA